MPGSPRPLEEWVPITAPAIISRDLAKAQEQLKRNQGKARRAYQPTSQRYLLRTLVRCGQCQLHMQAGHQLSVCKRYEYLYYCCAGKDPVTVGRVGVVPPDVCVLTVSMPWYGAWSVSCSKTRR